MAKSRQAEAMNMAEQQQYGKVHSKVEQGIVKARYLPQYGRMHYKLDQGPSFVTGFIHQNTNKVQKRCTVWRGE